MKNKKFLIMAGGLIAIVCYKYNLLSRKEKDVLINNIRGLCKSLFGDFLPENDTCFLGKSGPAAYSPDFGNEFS